MGVDLGRLISLDLLFRVHMLVAAACGAAALVLPHAYEVFFSDTGLGHGFGGGELLHEVIRLYGAIIVGQAFIVHAARKSASSTLRRGICRAYALIFSVTTAVLVQAMAFGNGFNTWAVLNVLLFGTLAALYIGFAYYAPESRIANGPNLLA